MANGTMSFVLTSCKCYLLTRPYNKLDRTRARDRSGRETVYTYDALRRLTSVTDPINRMVRFEYCGCGSISALIDALGRPTRFGYDIRGRVTSKQYADGSRVLLTYENTTSRPKSITDALGQTCIRREFTGFCSKVPEKRGFRSKLCAAVGRFPMMRPQSPSGFSL